jgi:hypothetical protein
MDLQLIRDGSIRTARQLGVDVLAWLPLLDTDLELRGPDETIARILAMHAVAAAAYGFDRAKAVAWLKQEALTESLTEDERRFVFEGRGRPFPYQRQVEGMWALAWALGTVDEMDFCKDCDNQFATMLPNLKQSQSSAAFRQITIPRPLEHIVATCDLAYCLHWALRQAELTGQLSPGGLDADLVVERRRALEWLLSKQPWNEVALDT